jgi:quercetin dioxygenase-like cupin family protein
MKQFIFTICCSLLLASPVCALESATAQVDVLAKTGASWNQSRLPAYPAGTPEINILKIKIPPGVQLPMRRHPVINAGVLLAGELTVYAEGGQTLHLQAGEAIVELVNQWHYGKNEGTEMAEIIVFYAGTVASPSTVKK